MQITDIKVRKLFSDAGPMKAVVSVTFDGQLALHDIKVINAREHLFIVMPSRRNPDGSYRDIVHPIKGDFRKTLETAVIEAYQKTAELYESELAAGSAEITVDQRAKEQETAEEAADNAAAAASEN